MVQPSRGEWVKALEWLLPLLVWAVPGFSQDRTPSPIVFSKPKRQVLVSTPNRRLAVLENGVVIRTFAVSVGAAGSPSPTGKFVIVNRLVDPTYYHTGVIIPPGHHNPLGPRWVGLNKKGYGIHGTNLPNSVGRAASHGCIRLRNRDVVEFAKLVNIGDTVEIRADSGPDIAAIFAEHHGTPAQVNVSLVVNGQ
jgi:lipoprotein-anchoring transpeptidase ErfK/SrfK